VFQRFKLAQSRKFEEALSDFRKAYDVQKRRPAKNNNNFMLGITAHNMGVVCVIAGRDHHALPLFEEAVALKREAFGLEHPEVAVRFYCD
jgi:Flp pilus assembly protein TadD